MERLQPHHGWAGTTEVTITGAGFPKNTAVHFTDKSSKSVTWVLDTQPNRSWPSPTRQARPARGGSARSRWDQWSAASATAPACQPGGVQVTPHGAIGVPDTQ
ncbi:IPT/TIG domain-containing protein [Streptomyces sp. Edi4]|uniref:IPT/TIG domain-containing protein n=1 Tax=Streptomyces sp. Edi4 TaxID=3162527 RepID=UPI0033064CC7